MKNPISQKVTWPALVGAVVTVVVLVLDAAGVSIPAGLDNAVQTILLAVVGYVVTDPLRQPPQ